MTNMAKAVQLYDFSRAVDRVVCDAAPELFSGAYPLSEAKFTAEFYDRMIDLFLKKISGSPYEGEHQLTMSRYGLRLLIDEKRRQAASARRGMTTEDAA